MYSADISWVIVATSLVLLMTLPGLALFYGGLVRARNVLSVFMQCFAAACLMSVLWLSFGYSIAFGSENAFWGGLRKAFFIGVDMTNPVGTIPEPLFGIFQMTFAIITPALIIGATVERIRFEFLMAFLGLWMLLCYAPVAHWIWGGGFLSGVVDFAGGIVVHETAGITALILAWYLGPRRDKTRPPHNAGLTMVGAALLWVGWFGFNGGSALSANSTAVNAILVTHISAATASLSWAIWERIHYGKASLVGLVTGTIAGLAAITPAAGSVGPIEALGIGAVAGVLCQIVCRFIKQRLKIDDTLDVFAVHGAGGIFGAICLVILSHANWFTQFSGIIIVGIWTAVISIFLIKVLPLVLPLRVTHEDEQTGLDLSTHGERAYDTSS